MKKSLLALAAMGAFAGAAQAQSSVTVYGILDVGYVGGNQKATVDNATAKETVSQFGQSAESTSRLGFRGVEDLGGGMSAFFTIETLITPQGSTMTGNQNRQTFVGVRSKSIGAVSIGTQYTVIHTALANTDPGQYNNIVGNVIYPQSNNLTGSTADGATDSYTVRANNMLKLESNNFAGFKGTAFYVQNNKNTNQATLSAATTNVQNRTGISGGTNNSTGWGLGIDYTWQKLVLTANYQSFKLEQPYSDYTNSTPVTNAAGTVIAGTTVVSTGTNATDNQMYFGGAYDFGILKAYLQYVSRKVTSNLDSNDYVKRTAQQIGVRGYITKTIEGWASGGTGRFTGNGAASPTANFNGWQVGSNYWLSKRTNLYAIYGQDQTSNTNVGGLNTNFASSNYALGVRHTF